MLNTGYSICKIHTTLYDSSETDVRVFPLLAYCLVPIFTVMKVLTVQPRLTWKAQSSCLSLLHAHVVVREASGQLKSCFMQGFGICKCSFQETVS